MGGYVTGDGDERKESQARSGHFVFVSTSSSAKPPQRGFVSILAEYVHSARMPHGGGRTAEGENVVEGKYERLCLVQ